MNSRERVFKTLEHEEPDLVPITDHMYMKTSLEAVLGEKEVTTDNPEKYMKACRALNFDLIPVWTSPPPLQPTNPEVEEEVDVWGRLWKVDKENHMLWYIDGPIKEREGYESYELAPQSDATIRAAKDIVKLAKGEYATVGMLDGPFTMSWTLMGFETHCVKLYKDPELVRRICQDVARWEIELGKRYIEAGVDILWVADDLGSGGEPLISPKKWREIIQPYFKEEVNAFKKRGLPVLMHSCGYNNPFIEDMIVAGINGFHPIERKAGMGLKWMKDNYGDRLTLIGNVEGKELVPYGTEKEIEKQIIESIKIGAPGGGYIFATDHSIHPGMPGKKARFTFRIARKYGVYPIS